MASATKSAVQPKSLPVDESESPIIEAIPFPASSKPVSAEESESIPAEVEPAGVAERGLALSEEERARMIANAAYFLAEKRGFDDSEEARLADWLAAEQEIDLLLHAQSA